MSPTLHRILLFLAISLPAQAQEKSGAQIYQQTCTACHGENGGGNFELKSPPIAGLPQWYLALQLERFRNGQRGAHPEDATGIQMAAIAKTLEPDAVAAVIIHVSEMVKVPLEPVEDADAERGKELYLERCASCHRFNASGEQAFRSPPLRDFPAWYLHSQYGKFKTGQRGTVPKDEDGVKMRIIAAMKTPEVDLQDIIGFITEAADKK